MPSPQSSKQCGTTHRIHLVDQEKQGRRRYREELEHARVARGESVGAGREQQDEIHAEQRLAGGAYHLLVHPIPRAMDPGRVHVGHLGIGRARHGTDHEARGLGNRRDDGYLGAYQSVQEGGLAHVRASDERDKA